ncbi:MAG: D-alanyl-D-alanine carboxypeptidase family protein [Pseudomonadota bacterium]
MPASPYPDLAACATISRRLGYGHPLPDFTVFDTLHMLRYALFLICSAMIGGIHAAPIVPSPPQIAAEAYLLMDADSGAILVEHEADTQRPPASLTKLMTSYVLALEIDSGRLSRSDMVTVSENAWSANRKFQGSSLMFIEPRVPVSVDDLEKGIVISSGNDATVAIAEHIAGSEGAFAEMMNAHAESLGMSNSHFVNSHGLDDRGQAVSARDLAILAQAIIQRFPEHYAIYKERSFQYGVDPRGNPLDPQRNRNPLLGIDSSVDGLKTGYTDEAGWCLVASAERNDMRLISVVLGSGSNRARREGSSSLLNYGFRFFETRTLLEDGEALDKPRIWQGAVDYVGIGAGEDAVLTLPRGRVKQVQREMLLTEPLLAPLAAGDAVGEIVLTLDGDVIHREPLVALEAVDAGGFFARLWDMVLMWVAKLFSA